MMDDNNKVLNIIDVFNVLYPEASCSLSYTEPYQLLVATQLSAQCTDERVNKVTPLLFSRYPTLKEIAFADPVEFESIIKPTGFFRNKTKNIIACCKMLLETFNGRVPDTLEELLKLPGVGRKTANLILGDVYGKPAIVVDTHAIRLSGRIGFTASKDPYKIELDLSEILPVEHQSRFCHQLVLHGRAICKARKPECDRCAISIHCNFGINLN